MGVLELFRSRLCIFASEEVRPECAVGNDGLISIHEMSEDGADMVRVREVYDDRAVAPRCEV